MEEEEELPLEEEDGLLSTGDEEEEGERVAAGDLWAALGLAEGPGWPVFRSTKLTFSNGAPFLPLLVGMGRAPGDGAGSEGGSGGSRSLLHQHMVT